MEPVVVSLGKAQKFLSVLKGYSRDGADSKSARRRRNPYGSTQDEGPSGVVVLNVSRATLNGAGVLGTVASEVKKTLDALDSSLVLQTDILLLKESIFGRNQEVGASRKMAEMELTKEKLKIKKSLLKSVEDAGVNSVLSSEVTPDFLTVVEKAIPADKDSAALTIRLFDASSLRAEMETLRVQLNKLDEEIRAINATTLVTVDLSPQSRSLLGIA
jgi:hypothetical protein